MPERSHILHLAEDFLSPGKASGGAPISIRSQIEELAKRCRVTVIAPRIVLPLLPRYRRRTPAEHTDRSASQPPPLSPEIQLHRPRYLHVPLIWPLTEPLQLFLIATWFALLKHRDAQIIHGHRAYPMGVAAVLAGGASSKPSVITAHGSDVHTQAVRGSWRVRGWIRWALSRASIVIAVSRELNGILESVGIGEKRRCYIPNGVDVGRFPISSKTDARRRLSLEPEPFVFLCVALFVPVKGHASLIDAFSTVARRRPDARLVLVGDGPLRNALKEQVRQLSLEDRVTFAGALDHGAIPLWMTAADVFVLPSYGEGTPLAALEALSSGRPVVGTSVGGTAEVVSRAEYGITVAAGDSSALAEAMEQAMGQRWDPEVLRGRAQDFAWHRLAEQIQAVYDGLLTRPVVGHEERTQG